MPESFYGLSGYYYKPWALFWPAAGLATAVFLSGLVQNVRFWLSAASSGLHRPLEARFTRRALWWEVLLQRQLFRQSRLRWALHVAMYWGCGLLFLLTAWEALLVHVLPPSALRAFFLGGAGRSWIGLWGDAAGLLVLLGSLGALLRRYLLRPPELAAGAEDLVAPWLLLCVSLSGFLLEGARLAALPAGTPADWSFAGLAVRPAFAVPAPWLLTLLWTMHAFLSLALLAYLPYGKLRHIFATPWELVLNASQDAWREDLYRGPSAAAR